LHVMSDEEPRDVEDARKDKWRAELYADEADMDEEESARFLRAQMSWRDWVIYDFLRYWYAAGAFALVCFLALELANWLEPVGAVDAVAITLALVGLIVLEGLGYFAIWPRGMHTDRISVRRVVRRWRRLLFG
jgi:hypothetical protein